MKLSSYDLGSSNFLTCSPIFDNRSKWASINPFNRARLQDNNIQRHFVLRYTERQRLTLWASLECILWGTTNWA